MEQSEQRVEQFKEEIAAMNVGGTSGGGERSLLIVGIVLAVLGVVLVLAGWWGASGESTVAQQFPYLLSGGVLGLAFVVAGAVLFARYSMSRFLRFWLVRLIYEQQAQTDRIVEALGNEARDRCRHLTVLWTFGRAWDAKVEVHQSAAGPPTGRRSGCPTHRLLTSRRRGSPARGRAGQWPAARHASAMSISAPLTVSTVPATVEPSSIFPKMRSGPMRCRSGRGRGCICSSTEVTFRVSPSTLW
ncbi:MAG: hypothetical protein U5R31_09620 [Acidimicrobiia bacterium]|nr:hypothetical protein [Acidimicrobiia bacterium]